METPEPNYASTKAAQETQHEHEREMQRREDRFNARAKAEERKHARTTALLTSGIALLGTILTATFALLGSYRNAAVAAMKCESAKAEISRQANLDPLRKFLDGAGAAFQAVANRSLAPQGLNPPETHNAPVPALPEPTTGPPDQNKTSSSVPDQPAQNNKPSPDLSQLCNTGDSQWVVIPDAAIPQQSGNTASYSMNLRFVNNTGNDAFFTYQDTPSLSDDAGNKLTAWPAIQMKRSASEGVRVAAGQSSMFTVSTPPAKILLGTTLTSFHINLAVAAASSTQSNQRDDHLSVGCHDIPVRQLVGTTTSTAPVR